MAKDRYSHEAPTIPGWYWCRNQGVPPGQTWEAIVRVDHHVINDSETSARLGGLFAGWMTANGKVKVAHESKWVSEAEWAGPIAPPEAR